METNWKNENSFDIHQYHLSIDAIDPSKTVIEQQTRIEKISLVSFLNEDQRKNFIKICRNLKNYDKSFYQNKNLHTTLFGFGPLEEEVYELIREKIQQFTKENQIKQMYVDFDCIRPGAMYTGSKTLRPLRYISNGTVIAFGDVAKNKDFFNYSNKLTLSLLSNRKIKSKLGANFRRKFPAVWCTLGYYDKKSIFNVDNRFKKMFNDYSNLRRDDLNFKFPISEIALVKSKYKNLRYPKFIQKYLL
jgi:hypothetical protein